MSGYSGRRGVNVSQYIANLNTVHPPEDLLDSPPNIEDDLALFTSNEFMDWDGSSGFEQNPASFDVNFEQRTNAVDTSATEPEMDFNLNSKYPLAAVLACLLLFGFILPISHCLPFIFPSCRHCTECVPRRFFVQ